MFRVKYEDGGPIVEYRPHKPVIDSPGGNESRTMYMFVTAPIVISFRYGCSLRTVVDLMGEMSNSILLPRNHQKLDFLWRLANARTDAVKNPCVIILYGTTGEEGKSTFTLGISRALGI